MQSPHRPTEKTYRVSEAALLGRIRQALAEQGKTLRRNRYDSRAYRRSGKYCILECQQECGPGVDSIEALGRELNVLGENEFFWDE
jgi:hypothetical protein